MTEGTRSGISHFFLNTLRIFAGFLFWSHGMQKIFAVFGREEAAELFTLIWFAGVIELVGGALIAVGLFVRPLALLCAVEMAVAFLVAHVPRGSVWPWENNGELALLYMVIFAFLAANGGGAFSLDGLIGAQRRGSTAG